MKAAYQSSSSRLSILEHLSSSYASDFLKDFYLIGCQHLLPSTHLMLRTCFDHGLRPERTALIGKCYSTSKTAQTLMKDEGIYVCPSSLEFDSHQPYDDQFQKNISTFAENAIDKLKIPSHAKIMVLDDGGELILAMHNFLPRFERIIAVEQTSAGYHKLANIDLKMPVINVARCLTKLEMESAMVTEAQAHAIAQAIEDLGIKPNKALIFGNGALGKYLLRTLRLHYDVVCYDKVPHLSDIDQEDLDISTFDLIIGATGSSILSPDHIDCLKNGAVLVSASSSDREFAASYLRQKVEKVNNCHTNLTINGVHLLNCGFPVNFQGKDEDSIPLEKIQLTIALLYVALYQGISLPQLKNGFVNLNNHIQKVILKKFHTLNGGNLLQNRYQKPSLRDAV